MAKILIVEDELIIAADLRYRLEALHYTVVGLARSASEAVERTAQLQPDLVLMDIRLTGDGDGIGAADHIRRRFSLPVVYLTAYADSETLDRATLSEPFGYVVKPVDDHKLHAALQVALHKHAMVRRVEDSERWLRAAVSCIGDGVIATDARARVRIMNRVAESLTGWAQQDAVGQDVDAVFRAIDQATGELVPNPLVSAVERRAVVVLDGDALLLGRDGKQTPIDDSAAPILDERGELLGAVLGFRDVSKRNALEAQLRQAQKMEAIGRLAGGVAHDFNNLLTVILGRSELLLRTAPVDDARRRDVELIHKTAECAHTLTRQLLAFGRKQVMAPRVLDVNAVLADMERMLRRLIREDVQLTIQLAAEPVMVRMDPVQLEQVVLNLAVNAHDAMPNGGQLTIATFEVPDLPVSPRPVGLASGPYVALAVADTGIGMDTDTRSHLFEPFFTTKGPNQGTGLGLASIYGIVTQNQGYIDVITAPNRGTRFTVYLPQVEARPAPARPVPAAPKARPGGQTILVVEDQDDVRDFIKECLEAEGYRVLTAPNGPAALHECQRYSGTIHLLLTDVVMPHMSGRELVERVRGARPEIKALYVSGYTNDVIALRGIRAAEGSFLSKPFGPSALIHEIQELLDP